MSLYVKIKKGIRHRSKCEQDLSLGNGIRCISNFLVFLCVCFFKETSCLCSSFAINKSYLLKVTMARDAVQLVEGLPSMNK